MVTTKEESPLKVITDRLSQIRPNCGRVKIQFPDCCKYVKRSSAILCRGREKRVFSVSLLRILERNLFGRLGRDAVLSPDEMSMSRYLELPDNSPSRCGIDKPKRHMHGQRHKPTDMYLLPFPEQGR